MSCVRQQEPHSPTPPHAPSSLFCSPFTALSNLFLIMSEHAEVMVSPLQLVLLRKKESLLNRVYSFILTLCLERTRKINQALHKTVGCHMLQENKLNVNT